MRRVKNSVAKRRNDTRKLYRFEGERFRGQPLRTIKELRRLGRKIWSTCGKGQIPPIVAGRGDLYNGRLYSYYDGLRIVLARNERRKYVLIHEMVHALGHDDHDAKFVKKYQNLLKRYNSDVREDAISELGRLHRQY